MKSVFNRTNTPSFIAGTLATLTLLASGVFAIAPYVAFLSSIAAIGISLPVILILFALSTAVIALSYKIISQNKKLDVKEAEFNEKIKLATNTHQIKGLNMEELDKKLSIQCDKIANLNSKIVKLTDSSAKKDDVEELRNGLDSSAKRCEEELRNGLDGAAKKFEEELDKKFNSKCDKMEELRKELSTAKEELRNELSSFETTFYEKLRKELDGVAIKCEEELQTGFYEKGQERKEIITLNDVILSNDIKQKLRRICESQEGKNALEKREGCILYGPPGTGKTMIARAIANETKSLSAFINIPASELFNESNIDKVFKKAKENIPCIIFIDEIDSIGKSRTDSNSKRCNNVGPLNHLLSKLDGFESIKGVMVIAATNRLDILDEALIRQGRLSKLIEIPTLDTDTRKKIINEHLNAKKKIWRVRLFKAL